MSKRGRNQCLCDTIYSNRQETCRCRCTVTANSAQKYLPRPPQAEKKFRPAAPREPQDPRSSPRPPHLRLKIQDPALRSASRSKIQLPLPSQDPDLKNCVRGIPRPPPAPLPTTVDSCAAARRTSSLIWRGSRVHRAPTDHRTPAAQHVTGVAEVRDVPRLQYSGEAPSWELTGKGRLGARSAQRSSPYCIWWRSDMLKISRAGFQVSLRERIPNLGDLAAPKIEGVRRPSFLVSAIAACV